MSSQKNYNHKSQSSNPSSDVDKIDITILLDDIFKELLKIWWLLIIIVSLTSSIFYFQRKLSYVPKYEASATYTVSADSPYTYSQSYYNQVTASNLGKTLEYLLSSASMKRIVAEDMGLKKIPGKIEVSNMDSTNLITITASSKDPVSAYGMLQSILKNYNTVCHSVIGSTILTEMDQSGLPSTPSNPENSKGAAKKGFMAGVVLDIALLCLLALTKRTIRKEEDFEKILNVECYGAIPLAKFKKRGKNQDESANQVLIDNYRIPGGFLESVRAIRTRLEQDAKKHNYRVFLVSSAIPGEGKSTVSANLAMGFARKGKKVILVDFDLRSPTIDEYLQVERKEFGTSDVLRNKCSLDDALIRYKNLPLYVLPGGDRMIDTMRILNGVGVKRLIDELRQKADYVILDTPPSAMLADAGLVARHADAAIFVVRQDYSRIPDIIEGVANLAEEDIPIAGCILNQAEVGITGYGYGYGYGYGRGYGYGYGYGRGYGYGGGYGYGSDYGAEDGKKSRKKK